MGFTTAVPEIARISLVAAMIGGWCAAVGVVLSWLIGDVHCTAKEFAEVMLVGGILLALVAGFAFFGQLIVSAIQMWWG